MDKLEKVIEKVLTQRFQFTDEVVEALAQAVLDAGYRKVEVYCKECMEGDSVVWGCVHDN